MSQKRKSLQDYAAELESLVMPELQRRAEWLGSIPLFAEAGLNHCDLIQNACASIRTDFVHALSCEPDVYLDHHGGDPDYFVEDPYQRKGTWETDLLDCFDRIKSLDLSHDPAFILFVVRGDQDKERVLTLHPPKMHIMASRGIRQTASASEIKEIKEFGEFFLNRIAIPFCNSWPQRRCADKALKELSSAPTLLPQRIRRRFSSDFGKFLNSLSISASTWLQHQDRGDHSVQETQAHRNAILQESRTGRDGARSPSVSRNSNGQPFASTAQGATQGGGNTVPKDAPKRNGRSERISTATAGSPIKSISVESAVVRSTPGSPLLGLTPPPRRNLGLQARLAAAARREQQGASLTSPESASRQEMMSPNGQAGSSLVAAPSSESASVGDHNGALAAPIASNPNTRPSSLSPLSVSTSGVSCDQHAYLNRPPSSIDSGSVRSILSSLGTQGGRPLPEGGSFIMPGIIPLGYTGAQLAPGTVFPPTHNTTSPMTSLKDVSTTQVLSSVGSISFTSDSEFYNKHAPTSQAPLNYVTSRFDIDPSLRRILKSNTALSQALAGIDWSLLYTGFTTREFATKLTPTMRAVAESGDFSLEAAALLYAVFDPSIVWAPNDHARSRLLTESLTIDDNFADFLVHLINSDLGNGVEDNEEILNDEFGFSPTLKRFIVYNEITYFASCHLRSLLSINISYETRIERLTQNFAISEHFARFLFYQYTRDTV